MIRSVFWLAAALAATLTHGAVAAEPPPTLVCDVPAELIAPARPLGQLARLLQPGGRLEVLALGSGTLLGPRGGFEGSVPAHMVETLSAASPGATVRLTLHGARAETATEMLAAMRKELAAHTYQLVLWQTGTVEAVRKLPPAQFRATLAEGAAAVAAAGADLVLIDVPYSRLLENNSDLLPYRTAMRELAVGGEVALFRRYDLMRQWAKTGEIDLEEVGKGERTHTAERLRACLGQALAKLVLAAREP
jgi:acyl-CoA thioesterase I